MDCQGAFGAGMTNVALNEKCCKGIFNPDEAPRQENATINGQFGILGDFMPLGCMCIDDIYAQDSEFFDAIIDFVRSDTNPCAAQTGQDTAAKSVFMIPSNQTSHIVGGQSNDGGTKACPTGTGVSGFPDNGFLNADTGVALNKEEMMELVLNMPLPEAPAPPTLPAATALEEIIAEVHLRNFNADLLNTTALTAFLETEIASKAGSAVAAADIKVTIKYFSRGGVMPDRRRRLQASSNENTVVTISITSSTSGADLTAAQVDAIRDVLFDWRKEGASRVDFGSTYGNATISAATVLSNVTAPNSGTVPANAVDAPPATLPAAATGLPRQGLSGTYSGGFELTNGDYLASLVGQALPGFAMAILLLVVMVLMIVIYIASTICGALCCKCCNGAYKPRKFTKKDLVINKVMILVFVALTAAGCFIIFSEAPKLLDSVSDLTQAMVDTILDLVNDGRVITDALEDAADDPSMAMDSMADSIGSMDEALDSVEDAITKAQEQIDEQLEAAGSLILAAAGGLFAVTFLVFAAAFIGWWRILILFIVILSLGMILAWIVWGIVSMITVLVDDLCWAMQDYLDNPGSSDLGDLIPCMDAASALDIMTTARSMSVAGIVGVNAFLEDYAGENPYQNYMCYNYVKVRLDELCGEENYYFDDSVTKYVCEAYAGGAAGNALADVPADSVDGFQYVYADAKCPYPTTFYKVALGDFGNDPNNATHPGVNNLKCPFVGFKKDANNKPDQDKPIAFAMGQCYAARQIPADMFEQSEASATLAQGILDVIPVIEGLLQCEFVDNAFSSMVGPCDDMALALTNLYAGFLLVALGYFLTWVSTLVVVSRLQYYKVGCTDAGDRYKN